MHDITTSQIVIAESSEEDLIFVRTGNAWNLTGVQPGDKVVVTVGDERVIYHLNQLLIDILTGEDSFFSLDLELPNISFVKAADGAPSSFSNFDDAVDVDEEALVQLEDAQGNRTPGTTIIVVDIDSLT